MMVMAAFMLVLFGQHLPTKYSPPSTGYENHATTAKATGTESLGF